MIKLDFSKGSTNAHQDLVDIFAEIFKRKAQITKGLKYRDKKNKTKGEIDLLVLNGKTLNFFEMKTNDNLNEAVGNLRKHQLNIDKLLAALSITFTEVRNVAYYAVIYELYTVYRVEKGRVEALCSIDEFLQIF